MELFFHQGALGDWVLTFPLVRGWQRPLTVVTAGSKGKLAQRLLPGIHTADINHPDWTRLFVDDPGGGVSVSDTVREHLAGATAIISFVSSGHDAWARNVRSLNPHSRIAFIPPRPPEDWPNHVADWHLDQLRRQGFDPTPRDAALRSIPAGPIVIHPGSGGASKCWPRERWEQVIRILTDDGRRVLPLLGEVERDTWPDEALTRWMGRFHAEPMEDLVTLADRLASASLFIGHDSGPTHLAAQLGVNTLALFGPTSPTRWQPRGPSVRVLAPPTPSPMTWLNPDTLLAAVKTGSPSDA